jgi:hypothetical protein
VYLFCSINLHIFPHLFHTGVPCNLHNTFNPPPLYFSQPPEKKAKPVAPPPQVFGSSKMSLNLPPPVQTADLPKSKASASHCNVAVQVSSNELMVPNVDDPDLSVKYSGFGVLAALEYELKSLRRQGVRLSDLSNFSPDPKRLSERKHDEVNHRYSLRNSMNSSVEQQPVNSAQDILPPMSLDDIVV